MASVRASASLRAQHGQHIFIYKNIRTNQIVYSLLRTMNNADAMRQLPFLGKRSKPTNLRKDVWQPVATVCFPFAHQGHLAYRQLREFMRRHYHEWDPVPGLNRLQNARSQRNQIANSVADLARVLFKQEITAVEHATLAANDLERARAVTSAAENRIAEIHKQMKQLPEKDENGQTNSQWRTLKSEMIRLRRKLRKPVSWKALVGEMHPQNLSAKAHVPKRGALKEPPKRFTMDGIRIEWNDIRDAEHAETWPAKVVHDTMVEEGAKIRNTHPAPQVTQASPDFLVDDVVVQRMIDAERKPGSVPAKIVSNRRTEKEEVQQGEESGLKRLVDRLKYGRR